MDERDNLKLRLSTGSGDLGKVKNLVWTWGELRTKLHKPVVDQVHTLDEYVRLPDAEQNRLKNQGFFVGGHCVDGKRSNHSIPIRSIVNIDIDDATPSLIDDLRTGMTPIGKFEWFAHTTRKHRPEKPRWRLVLPLAQELPAEHYQVLSRILASMIGHSVEESMDAADPVSFRVAQVMYFPTVCRDGEFQTLHNRGQIAVGAQVLKDWGDWQDWSKVPQSQKRPAGRQIEIGKKAENPTEKRGIVGAFCRAYDVPAAIKAFIPEIYVPGDQRSNKPRYTYTKGSGANGAIIEDDGLFLYSHHGTDPCGERLVNAFDMVRLHLFGAEDRETDEEKTRPAEMPSYKAMQRFLENNQTVIRELQKDNYDFDAMFEDADEPDASPTPQARKSDIDDLLGDLIGDSDVPDAGRADLLIAGKGKDWTADLDLTKDGGVKASLSNLSMILQKDPRFRNVARFNTFAQELYYCAKVRSKMSIIPQIDVTDKINGDLWTDRFDDIVRAVLESPSGKGKGGWGMRVSDRDLRSALNLAGLQSSYHPIQDYLTSVTWDGQKRLDTLFVDYLGTEDNEYARESARLTLVGAVTRVFEPGHKFDFVPILEGLQGKRKSTFIAILAQHWFAELEGDLGDRVKMVEKMMGKWIIEIPELSGFNKTESQELKAFVSATQDRVRLAWSRRAGEYKRQCIFIGSTNDREYLRDTTGNRRFWPIQCHADQIDTDRLSREVGQIWAEAYSVYRQMRAEQPKGTLPLYLRSQESQRFALELQGSRTIATVEDAWAGQIRGWLDTPVVGDPFADDPTDDLMGDPAQPRQRDMTCLIQVWVEALGYDKKSYSQMHAQQLARAMNLIEGWYKSGSMMTFNTYGRQRCYHRTPISKRGN